MANFILKGSGFYSTDARKEQEMIDKKTQAANRMAENYKKEEYSGKRYEAAHLTPGQRQYLARKGIRGREFDNLSPRAQREWIQEMKEGVYAKNDHKLGTQNAKYNY